MVTGDEWTSSTIQWSNKPAAETQLEANISHNNKTKYQFSCLAAVQHWYDGDTTGQNENYGVMIRYYDETIADYNSFYSADHTDETLRPAIVITYQTPTDSVGVDEGDTCTLTAPDVAGTITWTSDKPSIATVSSSGVVTAIKAGKAIVSAAVGDTVYKTYTIYVTIADGVYYIRNTNVGLNLGTYGGIEENTSVKLIAYDSSEIMQLRQLWKITYLDNGYYSIRPLHRLHMALHAGGTTGSSVDIVSAGINDTLDSVAPLNRWGISINADGDGYYLNHVNTTSLGLRAADGTILSGMNVTIAVNPSTSNYFEWSLTKVDDPPCAPPLYEISTESIIDYFGSRYITAGTTKTLAELDLGIFSFSENSTQNVTWSCKSGSEHLLINVNTGSIMARSPGTALVSVSNSHGSIDLYVTVTGTPTTDFTFINHYDASFMKDPDLVGYIDDAVAFVNKAYQRQFGITFSSSTDPYYRSEAITDDCPLVSYDSCHDDNVCEGACNTSHHKNIKRISDHFYSSTIPQDHIVVFWTDREAVSYCADGTIIAAQGCVIEHRPVVHIMSVLNIEESFSCLAFVFAHEVAHTFGYVENTTEHSGPCVMAYQNVTQMDELYRAVEYNDENLFCSDCEETMSALLAGLN